MTTIYIPQRIETAEQAEALPVGSVSPPSHPDDKPAVKITEMLWVSVWGVDDGHDLTYDVAPNSHMVGDLVLVPIEAEEEIGTELRHQVTDKRYDIHVMHSMDMDNARWQIENNPKTATGRIMRRCHTPWEEA